MSPRIKQGGEVSLNYNKRICTNVTSHVNSSKSNDPNTYTSDNIIGNSNLPRINVHIKRSSNELVTFQKETDTELSTSRNKENMDDNNASEEIASHQNSIGVNNVYTMFKGTLMLTTEV